MRESSGGASPARLAAWQQTTFATLRPKPTPFLDELAHQLPALAGRRSARVASSPPRWARHSPGVPTAFTL
jgi:hypothetical protein